MGDMGDAMAGMGPSMIVLWGLLGLIILGLAVAGGVWLGRTLIRGDRRIDNDRDEIEGPRDILQRRYATGEIGEDEYLRRLSGLDQP